MKRIGIAVVVVVAALAQNKLTTSKVEEPVYSVWMKEGSCGGLNVTLWSDGKGWHPATCMEVADKLSELRDVRNVTLSSGPDIPGMLAYSQYEPYFRIATQDFKEAQKQCRDLLTHNYATPAISSQCRETIKGVVPYGLKLKP